MSTIAITPQRGVDAPYSSTTVDAVSALTEVGYLLEREKGARAEAEFRRSIRAGQVMMVPLSAAGLGRMAG